jgi:hypothetical protein
VTVVDTCSLAERYADIALLTTRLAPWVTLARAASAPGNRVRFRVTLS